MDFWLGLLISIPLSILANLATPRVQTWFEGYSKKKSLDRSKNFRLEYQTIRKYHETSQEFTHYLLVVVIQTTFVGAVMGILTGVLGFLISVFQSMEFLVYRFFYIDTNVVVNIVYSIIQFLSLIGTLLIINICRRALNTWYKVKDFENYEKSLQPYLDGSN